MQATINGPQAARVGTRWFKRRWNESRGDAFDEWGPATYYFEVDDAGRPIRQVEVYDAGPTLRYGPGHEDDEYGQFGAANMDDGEDWSPWAISSDAFELVWMSGGQPGQNGRRGRDAG